MLTDTCRLLAVIAALGGVSLPERVAAATFAYGSALFPEGSVGRKFIYMEFPTIRSWPYANDAAASAFGTSLASITSAEEQSAVEQILDLVGVSSFTDVYFGARFTDLSCGNLIFEDGASLTGYVNWASGEPNLCLTQRAVRLSAATGKWSNTEMSSALSRGALALDPAYGAAPVPLPAPALMLLGALGGLVALRRRKAARA